MEQKKKKEKKVPRGTRWKRERFCYHCGKEGHLKWDGHQASKLPLGSVKTEKYQARASFRGTGSRIELSGKPGLKLPGVLTPAPILIIPEESQVLTVGANQLISFWTPGQFTLCLLEGPGPRFAPSIIAMKLSG